MKYSGRGMRLNADRLGAPVWVRPFCTPLGELQKEEPP